MRSRVEHGAAGEVGRHHVRGELHAVETSLERGGDQPCEARLGETRRAFEQHMSVGEQRDQQVVDRGVLADDATAKTITKRSQRVASLHRRVPPGPQDATLQAAGPAAASVSATVVSAAHRAR